MPIGTRRSAKLPRESPNEAAPLPEERAIAYNEVIQKVATTAPRLRACGRDNYVGMNAEANDRLKPLVNRAEHVK